MSISKEARRTSPEEDDAARLIRLLEARTRAALFGDEEPPGKRRAVGQEELEELEEQQEQQEQKAEVEDEDEDEDVEASDDEDMEEESFSPGIGEVEDEWSGLEKGKDGSGRRAPARSPLVVEFRDTSQTTSTTLGDLSSKADRKNFMATKITKMMGEANEAPGTKKRKKFDNDEEEEKHMLHLDRSLHQLISQLPSTLENSASSSMIPKTHSAIQKNTPRTLGRALTQHRLGEAKRAAEAATESGVVRAKGELALTKRDKRKESGEEDIRRRRAQGIGGVLGRMKRGVLTLSKDDLKRATGGASDTRPGSGGKRRR